MKKFFFIILCFVFMTPVNAEVLKAKAIETISTKTPKEIISVRLVRDFSIDKDINLKKDYILTGQMIDIVTPDKWHQNASFTFIPTSYTDNEGNIHQITKEIKASRCGARLYYAQCLGNCSAQPPMG